VEPRSAPPTAADRRAADSVSAIAHGGSAGRLERRPRGRLVSSARPPVAPVATARWVVTAAECRAAIASMAANRRVAAARRCCHTAEGRLVVVGRGAGRPSAAGHPPAARRAPRSMEEGDPPRKPELTLSPPRQCSGDVGRDGCVGRRGRLCRGGGVDTAKVDRVGCRWCRPNRC